MARVPPIALAILLAGSRAASAGSVLQPGSTAGLSPGKPLDQGLYFIDTSSIGRRDGTPGANNVNLPSFVWASPFAIEQTRVQFVVLQPVVASIGRRPTDVAFTNSTLFAVQFARDLGEGVGISYLGGYRAGMASALAFRSPSYEQRGALSYTAGGWNASVNLVNGVFFDGGGYPNWLNVDLTLTKKIDRVEIGAVAFGSTDVGKPNPAAVTQRQVAAGGLVGYDFGRFKLQAYGTTDLATAGYAGREVRGWLRVIVPLYKVPADAGRSLAPERL